MLHPAHPLIFRFGQLGPLASLRDTISQAPSVSTLKPKDRASDVGGNAEGKLGSGRMAARARPFSRALAESGEPQKFWRPRRWGRNIVIESVCLCDPALVVGYMYIVHRQHRTRRVLLPSCYHMIPRVLICEQVVNREASSRSVALAYGIPTVLRPSKNMSMGQSH
jgi:hypothetical protein